MKYLIIAMVILLSGCASYSGNGLAPEKDGLADVLRVMGEPAMRWQYPDGSVQLSYPRGPSSPESFMVKIGANGKLQSIRNVMQSETQAVIKPGMTKAEVLQILGPSVAQWTVYFPARNEMVWDWAYQVDADPAHFLVMFDSRTGIVRSTTVVVDRPPSIN